MRWINCGAWKKGPTIVCAIFLVLIFVHVNVSLSPKLDFRNARSRQNAHIVARWDLSFSLIALGLAGKKGACSLQSGLRKRGLQQKGKGIKDGRRYLSYGGVFGRGRQRVSSFPKMHLLHFIWCIESGWNSGETRESWVTMERGKLEKFSVNI